MKDNFNINDYINDLDDDNEYGKILESFDIDLSEISNLMEQYGQKKIVNFKKENEECESPKYAHLTDSGFDLYAAKDYEIAPQTRELISTGIYIEVPENYEIQIRSKSGLALRNGIFVLNSPGTIDEGYTGEIKVILFNTSNETYIVKKGSKVAQGVICPVVSGRWIKLTQVNEIKSKERGDNGFGSTGI